MALYGADNIGRLLRHDIPTTPPGVRPQPFLRGEAGGLLQRNALPLLVNAPRPPAADDDRRVDAPPSQTLGERAPRGERPQTPHFRSLVFLIKKETRTHDARRAPLLKASYPSPPLTPMPSTDLFSPPTRSGAAPPPSPPASCLSSLPPRSTSSSGSPT